MSKALPLAAAHHRPGGLARYRSVTPAMALGVARHVWSIGELLDAALAVAPHEPTETAPERRRQLMADCQ